MTCCIRKKKVKLPADEDKSDTHTAAGEDADNRTDDNIDERIQKFQNQLKNIYWYRVSLKYIVDIGQVNTPIKFNTKWRITFETDLQSYFKVKQIKAQQVVYQTTPMQK